MREKDNNNLDNVRPLNELPEGLEYPPRVHSHKIKSMVDVKTLDNQELDKLKIVYPGMADRKVLNAFREVRTKLFQLAGEENFVLMVSSVCEQGGASFSSVNLASAISLDRNRTSIVIDCNLIHPSLHKLLAHQPEHGLVDYVEDDTFHVGDIVYASGVPRLRVIPAGSTHEGGLEMFSAERMRELVKEIKTRYPDRYIIFDAPPITTSADARILQDLCDYCLLVVPYGKATKDMILSAVEAVDEERFAGLVFNNF